MRKIIKNHYQEKELIQRRILYLLILILLATTILLLRLVSLQVSQYDNYAKKSASNQYHLEPIVPKRGLIFDRNGKILAENIPAHRIEITPSKSKDINKTIELLGELINLDSDTIKTFNTTISMLL